MKLAIDEFLMDQNFHMRKLYDAYRDRLNGDPELQVAYDKWFGHNALDEAEALAAIAEEDANGTGQLQQLIDAGGLEPEPDEGPFTWPYGSDHDESDCHDEPQHLEWLETA